MLRPRGSVHTRLAALHGVSTHLRSRGIRLEYLRGTCLLGGLHGPDQRDQLGVSLGEDKSQDPSLTSLTGRRYSSCHHLATRSDSYCRSLLYNVRAHQSPLYYPQGFTESSYSTSVLHLGRFILHAHRPPSEPPESPRVEMCRFVHLASGRTTTSPPSEAESRVVEYYFEPRRCYAILFPPVHDLCGVDVLHAVTEARGTTGGVGMGSQGEGSGEGRREKGGRSPSSLPLLFLSTQRRVDLLLLGIRFREGRKASGG